MSHYTFHSLTSESKECSRDAFEAISFGGETFIYISLGFYTFSYTDSANWSFSFLFVMLSALIVGRVVVVVLCSFLLNCFCANKKAQIDLKKQMVIWWGGIVRGAICFALSLRKQTPNSSVIVTTTFAIVILTTLTIGSLTETFLICIAMKDPDPTAITQSDAQTHRKREDRCNFIRRIDEKYVKPIFGGRKRKVHELSIDNPEFTQKYVQFQTAQIVNLTK